MATKWRQAGLSYIQFSSICARVVRQSLKPEFQPEATRRNETLLKATLWQDGKPGEKKESQPQSTAGT